jgi:hypothetical protein
MTDSHQFEKFIDLKSCSYFVEYLHLLENTWMLVLFQDRNNPSSISTMGSRSLSYLTEL